MEKLNIAELLKDCPTGMELDCTICDNVYFNEVTPNMIKCFIKNNAYNTIYFNHDGTYLTAQNAKCVIFPKGKATWEGFERPFKDGDILTNKRGSICIYKGPMYYNKQFIDFYCGYRISDKAFILKQFKDKHFGDISEYRFATEEEKQKLFDTIKENGYRWNPKTKTLEKLPKFKDGDIVVAEDDDASQMFILKEVKVYENNGCDGECYFGWDFEDNKLFSEGVWGFNRLATEEEKERLFKTIKDNGYKWNPETKTLEKLIVPKFKVGDRIKNKYIHKDDCASEWRIIKVNNDTYTVDYCHSISFEKQDNYELVPNKFDITTLKPFEEVLVRYGSLSEWSTGIFSHTVKSDNKLYFIVNTQYWEQCIPYEGNEHLRGTTDACSDYFKTWE